MIAVPGKEFDDAAESETQVSEKDSSDAVGEESEASDELEWRRLMTQAYFALVSLTDDVRQDLVLGARVDKVTEVWRRPTR